MHDYVLPVSAKINVFTASAHERFLYNRHRGLYRIVVQKKKRNARNNNQERKKEREKELYWHIHMMAHHPLFPDRIGLFVACRTHLFEFSHFKKS